ncbi:hypothetical protein CLROS_043570 [Clostridium felsineum]|uniref:Uncharacterized protein n=1 Tax=Clostridium felsineum TaxID=36839 RepID=A0A1S8LCT2_9CLOT|nr:hypothetical protein CLROS_043570 [Clostridium felsineum]URZ09581.1 hypothetical protein CROST_002620 [Clostridium felsineum]
MFKKGKKLMYLTVVAVVIASYLVQSHISILAAFPGRPW